MHLLLRDLDAAVDWYVAQDSVCAAWQARQQPHAYDFIVSGVLRRVREFAYTAFEAVGLRAEDFVLTDSQSGHAPPSLPYIGNSSKIR